MARTPAAAAAAGATANCKLLSLERYNAIVSVEFRSFTSLEILQKVRSIPLKVLVVERLVLCNFRAIITLLNDFGLLSCEFVEIKLSSEAALFIEKKKETTVR